MARIRTLPKAAEHYKTLDPETHISFWILRRWVKDGKIPSIANGSRTFIDLDVVDAYLEGQFAN